MSKINILQPVERQRVQPSTAVDVEFILEYFSTNAQYAEVSFRLANDMSFSSYSTLTPTSLLVFNGSTYVTYSNGINILPADVNKKFKASFNFPNENKVKYLKVIIKEGTTSYESAPVMITSLNRLEFKLATPINVSNQPLKVKVTDKKTVVGDGITFKVEVTNNCNDPTPVWEDMTSEYLNGNFHTFTNKTCASGLWGINVRYTITKTKYTSSVEIKEVYVAHV